MAGVTRRLAFYDVMAWWLSDDRVQALLVDPRKGEFKDNPFFPVAQQPEGGFPYVRYTVARNAGLPEWWMHTENVGLDLYTMNIMDSTELLNLFIGMAGRGDESARDLEDWLDTTDRPRDFTYHSIEYVGGGDIGTTNEEGGAHSRIMMFAIQYSPLKGPGLRA